MTPYDPEGGRPIVCADTSQTACGACLSQECLVTGAELVCSYQSIQLTDSQRKFSASEREMLGCKWALERFAPLIGNGTGSRSSMRRAKLVTDHQALRQCIQQRSLNPRLNSWSLAMQSWDCLVEHRPGSKLAIPDLFSRMTGQPDSNNAEI